MTFKHHKKNSVHGYQILSTFSSLKTRLIIKDKKKRRIWGKITNSRKELTLRDHGERSPVRKSGQMTNKTTHQLERACALLATIPKCFRSTSTMATLEALPVKERAPPPPFSVPVATRARKRIFLFAIWPIFAR